MNKLNYKKMRERLIQTLLLLLVAMPLTAKTTVKSPNKRFEFALTQNSDKEICYSVKYKGEEIVKESKLGFDVSGAAWCNGLSLVDTKSASQDTEWKPVYGERSTIKDNYNELTAEFAAKGKKLNIVIRAYDEGVAYKYVFPESGKSMKITAENSTFTMPEGTKAYYSTWAQGPYELLPLEGWEKDSERPLTMVLKSGVWVAVGEANLVDYARGRFNLDPSKRSTLVTKLAGDVVFKTPFTTPWRTIMAADKAIDLINNNDLFLNLSDPCKIKDTSWIKPGKVFRTGLTMAEGKAGVDFAAARGLQYVHFDAGWYGPERNRASDARVEFAERDLKMKAICDYAATKGIGVLVYVNKIALYEWLDELLPLYKEWGIKGIKFGFVDVGSQKVTKWQHDAIAKCAEYELMVDVHDEYRPTGVSRTYPNLLTQEGIRGNEEMPDPFNNVILPYTRYLCGAGDYTPCYFSKRIQTTHAHQLAMIAVYYSPFQFLFWYDRPHFYRGEKELEFWANAPTVWDDSRAIDGQAGEYIVMARRTGKEWFVGAMTNGERTVTLDTSDFLDKKKRYEMSLYQDNPKLGTRTNVEIIKRIVKSGEKITLPLLGNGGAALHFVPVK